MGWPEAAGVAGERSEWSWWRRYSARVPTAGSVSASSTPGGRGLDVGRRRAGGPRRLRVVVVAPPWLRQHAAQYERRHDDQTGGGEGRRAESGGERLPRLVAELAGDRGAGSYLRRHSAQEIDCSDLATGVDVDAPDTTR